MNELVYYNAAKQALQQAASIDEVREVKDKAAAMKLYAQMQNDKELERYTNQIKLRAMRRIGELCKELEPSKNQHARSSTGTGKVQSLLDAGLTKTEAWRCEQLAALPEDVFEKEIEKENTATDILNEIKKEKRKSDIPA